MQSDHPLAFISRALGPKLQLLLVYEKELLAMVFAVQKWEQYLMGGHFIIKTDQKSLKWLLQQKISTPFQQLWLSKLMGFDYEIQYKAGKENVVADALSRVPGLEILCQAISVVDSNLLDCITHSYTLDINTQTILHKLQQGELVPYFTLKDNLVRRNGKLVIGPNADLKKKLLHWQHASVDAGHSGREATLKRMQALFYWRGLKKDMSHYVRHCLVCQSSKYETIAHPGKLQPLPIPAAVWVDVSLDFIAKIYGQGLKFWILITVPLVDFEAKKKVALLLQKLKKYELPELPASRHDPELLTPEQLQAFKKIGFRNKNYCEVGVRGVFGGVVQNMHLHWKFHETVQVCCDNFPKERIKEMATMLARLSGGIVVNVHNVKTIIMFRGRNYRQPKNLIPVNTLSKRKALFKARFEQALESQKLNIKKIEQQLRKKGISPDDPVAMASIQRVASTFFNAIDKKEGSPYVFRGAEESMKNVQKSSERSEPGEDSDQEELDKFIAEIEDAVDKEWEEEEAAENDEFGRIRYRNKEDFGGRPKPERFVDNFSDDGDRAHRGRGRGLVDAHRRQNKDSDDDDEGAANEYESHAYDYDDDKVKHPPSKVERWKPETLRRSHRNQGFKNTDSGNKLNLSEEESGSEYMFEELDDIMWVSDDERHVARSRTAKNVFQRYHGVRREKSRVDAEYPEIDSGDEGSSRFRELANSGRGEAMDRKWGKVGSDIDEGLSDLEISKYESDGEDAIESSALKAVDEDYIGSGGLPRYFAKNDNESPRGHQVSRNLKDEVWDSD